MSTYGRNFGFRVQPHPGDRHGRYINPSDGDPIVMGAPVEVDTSAGLDDDGRLEVNLRDGAVAPVPGLHGIALFEYAPVAFAGDDPFLVKYSDKDTVPVGAACYLVSGTYVKVVLTNTTAKTFGTATYAARTMIDGVDEATPGVAIGNYLTPNDSPDDTAGYWKVTGDASEAWLVVTAVDFDRNEVEARFVF